MRLPFTFIIIAPKNEKGKSFFKKLISYRSELSNLVYGLPGEYARYYSYHIVFRSPTAVLIGLLDDLLQNVESVVRAGGLPESNQ